VTEPLVLHQSFGQKKDRQTEQAKACQVFRAEVIGLFPFVSSSRLRPVLEFGRANGMAPGIAVLCVHRRSRSCTPPGRLPRLAAFALHSVRFLGMLGPLSICFSRVFPSSPLWMGVPVVGNGWPCLWSMYCPSRVAGRTSKPSAVAADVQAHATLT